MPYKLLLLLWLGCCFGGKSLMSQNTQDIYQLLPYTVEDRFSGKSSHGLELKKNGKTVKKIPAVFLAVANDFMFHQLDPLTFWRGNRFCVLVLTDTQKGKKALWGFCDTTGKVVIPPTYQNRSYFNEGTSVVEVGNLFHYIDTAGQPLFDQKFGYAYNFSEGLACVKLKEEPHTWVINRRGEKLFTIPSRYSVATAGYRGGFLSVYDYGGGAGLNKRGFIDRKGNFVIPPAFIDNSFYSTSLKLFFLAKANEKGVEAWGVFDTTGKVVLPLQFTKQDLFVQNGIGHVRIDGVLHLFGEGGQLLSNQAGATGLVSSMISVVDYLTEGKKAFEAGDFVRAEYLFRGGRSAAQPEAYYWLGKMYLEGKGVNPDSFIARRWFQRAQEAGFEAARLEIQKLDQLWRETAALPKQ